MEQIALVRALNYVLAKVKKHHPKIEDLLVEDRADVVILLYGYTAQYTEKFALKNHLSTEEKKLMSDTFCRYVFNKVGLDYDEREAEMCFRTMCISSKHTFKLNVTFGNLWGLFCKIFSVSNEFGSAAVF